jgi:autophagy-related protein 9
MLNHGVINLDSGIPLLRQQPLMTTAVSWIMHTCLLGPMFDDRFMLRSAFLINGQQFTQRLRLVGVASVLLAPFLLVFLLMHYFLKHMERIYHHPSSLGTHTTLHSG